jgi:5-methylcytosine-specific restriction endonuclease McrA
MRDCKTCGTTKSESDFYQRKDYVDRTCRECRKEYSRKRHKASDPAKRAADARKWRKENPEKAKMIYIRAKHRRKEKLRGTLIDLTVEDWSAVLSYFKNSCAICDHTEDLQLDHFIPVASGNGDTSKGNVIPLCSKHNINKRDKHPILWLRYESGASTQAIENIINYLAEVNGMLPALFEDYVNEQFYDISDEDYYFEENTYCDLSLDDPDNFIYDDDEWYLTILNGRRR